MRGLFIVLSYAARVSLLAAPLSGIAAAATPSTPIQHVIIIMQENRSFDNYFGTFPGADGIPPGTCVPLDPNKASAGCVKPFHDFADVNDGGPHGATSAQADIDDGISQVKMDGFVQQQIERAGRICAKKPSSPLCSSVTGFSHHDVVGYHTAEEIPSYWAYAKAFVLQDHLFAGVRSQSLPNHLDLTSEWSAICTNYLLASSCSSAVDVPNPPKHKGGFPWVNLFQLLDVNHVSWKYYLSEGAEPDCDDEDDTCEPQLQSVTIHSTWNPAPYFSWVKQQGSAYIAAHNPITDQFLVDVKNGTLPQVSWIVPNDVLSEHPNRSMTQGMEYVASLVNAVMQSPYWNNTAIFISWDDWGGFYDHVQPPIVDMNNTVNPVQGFGIRVPGLLVSAWAKPGYVDHQVLSFDNYAKFFEDIFMSGARLDPTALGNPDSRPTIRDELKQVTYFGGKKAPIGDLINEFDFTQKPLPPLLQSTHTPTGIAITCRKGPEDHSATCTKPIITVSWNAVTGPEVPGPFVYHITRDGTELPQCTGSALSCTDQPATGQHWYRVYSVDSNNVVSPISAAAEADAM